MRNTLLLVILFAFFAACITSCGGNAPKLAKYIPKDAGEVAGFNAKSLLQKLDSGGVGLDSIVALLGDGKDSSASSEWNDIKNAGVNLDDEVYAFGKTETSIMNGKTTTIGAAALLKDAGAFEQYLKKKRPDGEVKKEAGYEYLALGDDYVAGWTKDVALVVKVHSGTKSVGIYGTGEGTFSQQLLTKMFAQGESESIEAIDAFKTTESQQGDMMFFANLGSSAGELSVVSLSKIGDLIDGTYVAGNINFEKGDVKVAITGYPGNVLGQIFDKYPGRAVDTAALGYYPLPVEGFAAFSLNPQVLVEIVKFALAEETVKQMLAQYNITLDDISKVFKGDFAMAGSLNFNFGPQTDNDEGQRHGFMGDFVFSAPVADKNAYNKIVAGLNAKGVQIPQNGMTTVPFLGDVAASITDKGIVLASNINLLQQYLAGSTKTNLPADVKAKMAGKGLVAYADMQALFKKDGKDTNMVKDFIITGDKLNGKAVSGEAELRLFNSSQNSLPVLVKEALAARGHERRVYAQAQKK